MKNFIITFAVVLTSVISVNAFATEKTLVECSDKGQSFSVVEEYGVYTMKRSVIKDRIGFASYIGGYTSAESLAEIAAVSNTKKDNSLVLNFEDGKKMVLTVTKLSNGNVRLSITADDLALTNTVNELLMTRTEALVFSADKGCTL